MPDTDDARLLARWAALAGTTATRYGRELIERYREPHRRYHTATHLAHVLDVIDLLDDGVHAATAGPAPEATPAPAAASTATAAVRFAAWFHDAIYNTGADTAGSTNEERSARLAENMLGAMGSPDVLVAEVARLVRCTADHRVARDDRNAAMLCDADLAILGSEPRDYARYAEQIRDEYREIPDAQFRSGRSAILRSLLDRPTIYLLPRARALYETKARANIAAELERLPLDR